MEPIPKFDLIRNSGYQIVQRTVYTLICTYMTEPEELVQYYLRNYVFLLRRLF